MGIEDMTKTLVAEARNQNHKPLPESAKKAEKVAFAKFYIESKFGYNLSENRILEILKSMKTSIPQSSLNYWMHQIMTMLRERLEVLMTEAIRQSKTTYNDETRILVRSRIDKNAPFKYNVEYIHAALSLEKKLVSMVYDEGTRSHEVQEKAFFRESNIRLFMADRAPLYSTIVKDLEEYEIERAACWVHSRRLFINAFLSDERVRPFLKMINASQSCKLNNINFGVYIEDILTRIMKGETIDNTLMPNQWAARTAETRTQTA